MSSLLLQPLLPRRPRFVCGRRPICSAFLPPRSLSVRYHTQWAERMREGRVEQLGHRPHRHRPQESAMRFRAQAGRSVGKMDLNGDVLGILPRGMTILDSGDAPTEMALRTASCRLTGLTKLYPNAGPILS